MSATSHTATGGNGHSDAHAHAHPDIGFLKKYIFSVDHKVIGIQFLFMGLMFFVVGGLLAMLIRWQMAWPDEQTQGRDNPVPILAKTLFSKIDGAQKLGQIAEIDTTKKTVTLNDISSGDIRKADSVTIKAAGGDVSATVESVGNRKATLALGDLGSATLKAGDAVMGKRVPGSMPPDFYTMVFSMHATIMIFFVIIPLLVGTFGNYLIPLKIGAGDMAFPFLNGLAFWSALPSGAIMVASFFMPGGAAAAGWTSYPPLSSIQQTQKPWDPKSWKPYVRPETVAENLGDKLRIKGKIIDLPRGEFASRTLTVPLAPDTEQSVIDKVRGKVNEGLDAYRKRAKESAPAGITASLKTENGKSHILISGADEGVARDVLTSIQDKLTWQGTWSDFSVMAGFFSMFMMFAFICAYFIRLDSTPANVLVSIVLSLIAGYFVTKGVQWAAFDGQSAWFLSIVWLGFSSLMGGINYLTTIIKLRCPGMTMFRMPLSVWSLFITSLLVVLATPVLASALTLNLLDHHRISSFFLPLNWLRSNATETMFFGSMQSTIAGGGYPILHQHLFWFYSHPAVYIMILPAMGMVSDILAVFARKPIFGYRPMVYAMAGIAFLGFIVWAHHMFQSGMNPTLGTTFAISTMFIAVPSAIKTFNWLGTLWRGNIRFTVPMLNALAFVSMFVIGGLSGIFMASTAVDVHIHDTYFIVAHIHYVLFGGSTFGIFAAIYFWYPKMFGRMMNSTLGHIHFWLSFIFFNGTFFAMHILGMRGFPRRIAGYLNYESFRDLQPMNVFITICAFGLGLSQIPFAINFIGSWIWGKKAEQNPWEATTLEWVDAPTPPPHGNFAKVPLVYHGPYEYSSPLIEQDWLPQTRHVEGAEALAAKGH